jgi:hypothetical protein
MRAHVGRALTHATLRVGACAGAGVPIHAMLSARHRQLFTRVEFSLRARRAGDVSQEDALAAAAAAEASAGGGGGSSGGASQKKDWALVSAVEVNAAVRSGALTVDDVDSLDKSALRSALIALGAPSAGKLQARGVLRRARRFTLSLSPRLLDAHALRLTHARVASRTHAQDLRDRLRAALASAPKP